MEIRLARTPSVSVRLIDAIGKHFTGTSCSVLLILDDGDGFSCEHQGVCLVRRLRAYWGHGLRTDLRILMSEHDDWDYCVIIPRRHWASDPVYFSYVLAHELAHAVICEVEGLETHIACSLVEANIRAASDDAISRWEDLPQEQYCDQYAKAIAVSVSSELEFQASVCKRLSEGSDDRSRLAALLALPSTIPEYSVQNATADLISPHRDALIELLRKDRQRSPQSSLVGLVSDFDGFLPKPT